MTTIQIRKRRDDYHAQIKNMPTHQGCGETGFHAIGDLVKTHPENFGLTIGEIAEIKKLSNYWAGVEMINTYNIKIEDCVE